MKIGVGAMAGKLARLESRIRKLEQRFLRSESLPAEQRKRLERMLRNVDGRSLQTWYREAGHDSIARLMQTLPMDVVERMRLTAPQSLWRRWVEATEGNGPSIFSSPRLVAEAIRFLEGLEEMGQIYIPGLRSRPQVDTRQRRGLQAQKEGLQKHAEGVVKRMKELL
jgi:hypothetical protein